MKETIKTLVIFLLSALTVVLVANLWNVPNGSPSNDIITESNQQIEDVSYLIDIKSINVGLDYGQMTTFFFDKQNIFDELKTNIANALIAQKGFLNINLSRYIQRRGDVFLEFNLSDDISANDFLTIIKGKMVNAPEGLSHITRIMLSSDYPNQLFIADRNQYYELDFNANKFDIKSVINTIEQDSFTPYSSLTDWFIIKSAKLENKFTLVPNFIINQLKAIGVTSAFSHSNDSNQNDLQLNDATRRLAYQLFGSRLNFVQQLIDTRGSILMLYSYGERALKITLDGSIEYSQKLRAEQRRNPELLNDLKRAITYFNSIYGSDTSIYLDAIEEVIIDDTPGYRFAFSYRLNGYSVKNKNGSPSIEINIIGGQLKSLKSTYKDYVGIYNSGEEIRDNPIYSLLSDPEINKMLIKDYELLNNTTLDVNDAYIEIFKNISNFCIAYINDQNDVLRPVYIFEFSNYRYYFDIETIKLLYKEVVA